MERRTVTPGSWFVTAAFSATDSAGHRSVSVFEPPDGTAVERATELGTTTSAASALAGKASRAMVSGVKRANREGMRHATTGLRGMRAVSILTAGWARYL
jgi:hypothetical protein